MSNKIILELDMPKSKKNRYKIWFNKNSRGSFLYKDKEWTAYEQSLKFDLQYILRENPNIKKVIPLTCLELNLTFYFKTKRRKDLVNLAQFIDIFVEMWILEDDDWKHTWKMCLIPLYDKDIEKEYVNCEFIF